MSLKHAVLALIVERRGYGYELVQRFEERVGPGWQLNPSAVYPALDQLERGGLATSTVRNGGTRRSPRVVYAATPAGEAALESWLRATNAPPEPMRADLHLRIAFARPEHRGALAAQLAAHARAHEQLLTRYPRAGVELLRPDPRAAAAVGLVDAGVVARLRAELAWLEEAQRVIEQGADADADAA
jgi:DNA-binding PadR family transcriptional regulator